MTALAFKPVALQKRRAKVLLIGEAGVGKTHAALTFPNPAVIDAEGSIDWFADRFKFVAVPTKSYADVRDLVAKVRTGAVKCDTLIIDSLTSIYNGLVNAATIERQKQGSDDLRPLDWGRIKRKFSSLLDELYHQLPVNVVCVGWIKPEYAKPGEKVMGKVVAANDLVRLGETFDGDRKTLYAFDFAFKVLDNNGKRTRAQVIKSRSGQLTQGQIIEDFGWPTLKALLPAGESTYQGMSDEEQEARDSGVLGALEPSNGKAATKTPQPPAEGPEKALRASIRAAWKGTPAAAAIAALTDVCGTPNLDAIPAEKLEEFLAKTPSLLAAIRAQTGVWGVSAAEQERPRMERENTEASARADAMFDDPVRARKALMAFCSKELIDDEQRHSIGMMSVGLASTSAMTADDLRKVRGFCEAWVDQGRPEFEAWIAETFNAGT